MPPQHARADGEVCFEVANFQKAHGREVRDSERDGAEQERRNGGFAGLGRLLSSFEKAGERAGGRGE
jgi:hypothetical protein